MLGLNYLTRLPFGGIEVKFNKAKCSFDSPIFQTWFTADIHGLESCQGWVTHKEEYTKWEVIFTLAHSCRCMKTWGPGRTVNVGFLLSIE